MRQTILKYIRHKPRIRKFLSYIYLNFIKLKNFSRKNIFQDIYYVNPDDIQNESWKYFNIFKETGVSISWDWDLQWKSFEENTIYLALKERFIEKKVWRESQYFLKFSKEISAWRLMWNCSSDEELLTRCSGLDELYNDIKKNWYKRNKDAVTGWYDEVSINIWRHGELLFNDGAHRLSMAKILGLKKIPVRIIVRHKSWFNFFKHLQSVLPNQRSYQSLWHPDLDTNFTIDHPCYDRFEMFSPHLPIVTTDSRSLDIWGNIWFFTRELEKRWFTADIIEHESFYLEILKNFKDSLWYSYNIIWEDMFTWSWISENKYDVVLALSIFHHFIKTEEFHNKLVKLLNNLDTKVIIFEAHHTQEEQMEWTFRNYSAEEFVQFIMKETGLKNFQKIWVISTDNRELYKIYT